MKVSEIRASSLNYAVSQLKELRAELAKEKAVAAGGTRPENPGKIRSLRRNIARLLTVIREKEPVEGKEKKEKEEKKPVKKKPVKKLKKRKASKVKDKKKVRKKTLRKKKKAKQKKARPVKKKAKKKEVKQA